MQIKEGTVLIAKEDQYMINGHKNRFLKKGKAYIVKNVSGSVFYIASEIEVDHMFLFNGMEEFFSSSLPSEEVELPTERVFKLSPKENEAFIKSGSKRIMFINDSGIGIGVYYQDKNNDWIDITDYSNW